MAKSSYAVVAELEKLGVPAMLRDAVAGCIHSTLAGLLGSMDEMSTDKMSTECIQRTIVTTAVSSFKKLAYHGRVLFPYAEDLDVYSIESDTHLWLLWSHLKWSLGFDGSRSPITEILARCYIYMLIKHTSEELYVDIPDYGMLYFKEWFPAEVY